MHILEDTRGILTRITEIIKHLPENALLVSFDVVGLYPHVPHEEGIEIMKKFLNQREVKNISISRQIRTSSYILDLVIVMFIKSQSRMERLFE